MPGEQYWVARSPDGVPLVVVTADTFEDALVGALAALHGLPFSDWIKDGLRIRRLDWVAGPTCLGGD